MIFTNSDGGSKGNPGPGAIGVIVREDEKILTQYSAKIGESTSNIAEYHALIKALELASKFTNKELTCVLDSELVVKQLLGEYRVQNAKLLSLFIKVQKLQEHFEKITYKHVSREDKFQKVVDKLLNDEMKRE
jgi:ribonuclease HI